MRTFLRAVRLLRKNWKLTAISVFSLSIAMALGVVSLGVSNTTLLVAPAGADPGSLVMIYLKSPGQNFGHVSYPDFDYYRHSNSVFTDIAAIPVSISANQATLASPGQSSGPIVTVTNTLASENYFSLLGLRPFLGRLFVPGDDGSKSTVAVLTYSGWQHLGSDPDIVGKIYGGATGATIIGVAPKEFTGSMFGINGDMVQPLPAYNTKGPRDRRDLLLLARLKPGVTRSQAQAEMTVLSSHLAVDYPNADKDRTAIVTRATLLPPEAIPTTELVIAILLILMLLVLLIACANVANLLLALAVGRRHEAVMKLALGASRMRLVREFLMEGTIICAVSGALGYVIADAAILRYSNISVNVPGLGAYSFALKVHLGFAVVISTIGLMGVAILATGLPAALYASSPNLSQILSGEIVVGGTRKAMRRNALVIVQVAICTLVLVGMGLCQRSLYNLRHVGFGFSERNLIAEPLYPGDAGYTKAKGQAMYDSSLRAIEALPGVESVALASELPLLGNTSDVPVRLPGSIKPVSAWSNTVGENYFRTLGIPVFAGRVFSPGDTAPSPDVLVINRTMAQTLWPEKDAVGKAVLTGDPPRDAVVIGVVGDGKYGGIDEQPHPFIYYAAMQHYQSSMMVVARTAGDPRLWVTPVWDVISKKLGFDSEMRPVTMANVEDLALFPQRMVAGSVSALSALGLLLAIVGLFGAISYSVSERKKELGIRVALGAQRWQLLQMILRQTAFVAGTGVVVGIALGIAATAILRSQFFGIGTVEWAVLVPVAAAMLTVSLVVAWISARPWIKVDPMEAVRHA